MPDRGCQCPFTERVDHRCSSSFSLDRLDHAFRHCFGDYKACPLYQELLAERTMKRSLAGRVAVWVGSREQVALRPLSRSHAPGHDESPVPLVALTVAGRGRPAALVAHAAAAHGDAKPAAAA